MENQKNEKEIMDMLERLIVESGQNLKDLKKEIEKNFKKDDRDSIKKIVVKNAGWFIDKFKNFDDIKNVDNKLALIKTSYLPVWWLEDKHKEFFGDFILKTIVSPDGKIREAVRNFGDFWRMCLSENDNESSISKYHYKFLLNLKSLLQKYEPKDKKGLYLDKMPPSVYKTLTIFWQTIAENPFMFELFAKGKYTDLIYDSVKRTYDDEEWLDQNPIIVDDVIEEIWSDFSITKETEEYLVNLFNESKQDLITQSEIFKIDISSVLKPLLFSELETNAFDIITKAGFQYYENGKNLDTLNSFVRALQTYVNYFIFKNSKNESVNVILREAMGTRQALGRKEPKNFNLYIRQFYEVHKEIKNFGSFLKANNSRDLSRFNLDDELYQKIKEDFKKMKEELGNKIDENVELSAYAFNWYAQNAPQLVLNKEPKKLAAISFGFIDLLNTEIFNFKYYPPFSRREIADFGGWKSFDTYSVYSFRNEVLYSGQGKPDIRMFLFKEFISSLPDFDPNDFDFL
jgi:hypothetical protein